MNTGLHVLDLAAMPTGGAVDTASLPLECCANLKGEWKHAWQLQRGNRIPATCNALCIYSGRHERPKCRTSCAELILCIV